jgi:Ca-activated chloride channel family protein
MNSITLNRLSALILAAALVACSVSQSGKDASISHQEAKNPVATPSRSEVGKPPQEQQPLNKRFLSEAVAPQVKQRAPASRIDQAMAGSSGAVHLDQLRMPSKPLDRENYAHFDENPVKLVAEHPVSTFSIDVDTGAYANVRRFLREGRLPVHDAVRVEELINYFSYNYRTPTDKGRPFGVTTAIAPAPWDKNRHLLQIGIKGYDIGKEVLPPANLVFLIDVSGSMRSANKLELLKTSLKLLTQQLRKQDRISIVVYAGASGVVLEPVAGDATGQIIAALDALTAGGSTNGGDGIRLAYAMAEQAFIKNGINRVLLATDGDFNVGTVNFEALKNLVEEKRRSGIALTTLGFGTGNYNDHLMEQLADAGNGNYAYIDNLNEAQKVLVEQMSATMLTIAKDVKIQIEFNPDTVAEYRLIGYENRALRREDFANDKVDAGEIGAGHTVTALYEIVLRGSAGRRLQPLRYAVQQPPRTSNTEELAFLRIRYKLPESDTSQLMEWPLKKGDMLADISQASEDFRFSAAVAAFGQMLRGGKYTGKMSYENVAELARNARGNDRFGYRGEFIQLVNLAQSLAGTAKQARR